MEENVTKVKEESVAINQPSFSDCWKIIFWESGFISLSRTGGQSID